MLMPPKYLHNNPQLPEEFRKSIQKELPKNVLMERSYLRPWKQFFEMTSDIDSKIKELLDSHIDKFPRFVDSNIVALRALSTCKFGAPELRSQIYKNI